MATNDSRVENLISWTAQNKGYLHPNVSIQRDPQNGYYAKTKIGEKIQSLTKIASCPMACTLSILNAMDVAPFQSQRTRFPVIFIRNQPTSAVQCFFLMEQYLLGPRSWWFHYISLLPIPAEIEELEFTTEEDLAWIDGTNLNFALGKQTEKWQDEFQRGLAKLRTLEWPVQKLNSYTWELYRWAARIYGSRSFSSQVLADTLPADQARPIGRTDLQHRELNKLFSDGFAVLLPLLDLLNHRPLAKVEWQARSTHVGLQVLQEWDSDQEIFNNYGPRDNETLLLSYGFVIEDNCFDHFSVSLKCPPGSPLETIRNWPIDPRSDAERRCYIFNSDHPRMVSSSCFEFSLFSYDLLDTLSSLCSNDRELQEAFMAEQTWMSYGMSNGFEDNRNIYATITQILQECKARRQILMQTYPQTKARSRKQTNAQIYRDSQLSILSVAIQLCLHLLRRARGLENDSVTAAESSLVSKLTQLHPYITKRGELVSSDEISNMLSNDVAESLKHIIEQIKAFIDWTETDRTKAEFAVAVAALQFQQNSNIQLPDRLKTWLQHLCHWYPPDDPNWSYVPTGVEDFEAPKGLMQLLKAAKEIQASSTAVNGFVDLGRCLDPELLSWGWNVLEEEGVSIPGEVEAKEDDKMLFRLYWPVFLS